MGQWIGAIPSPLPKQVLVGVDEQQLDLEKGYPTYFRGVWYPEGMGWYYLVGLVAKEQLIFTLGLQLFVVGSICLWRRPSDETMPASDTSALREQRGCWEKG